MADGYRTQQVCQNGHQITSDLEYSPERASAHCAECGAATLHQCPGCGANIRGYYHVSGVLSLVGTPIPKYCHSCGKPYPWMVAALEAAEELADELDGLSDEDREVLKGALADISKDGPRTELGATRIKKIYAKAGSVGQRMLEGVIVNIASGKALALLGLG